MPGTNVLEQVVAPEEPQVEAERSGWSCSQPALCPIPAPPMPKNLHRYELEHPVRCALKLGEHGNELVHLASPPSILAGSTMGCLDCGKCLLAHLIRK